MTPRERSREIVARPSPPAPARAGAIHRSSGNAPGLPEDNPARPGTAAERARERDARVGNNVLIHGLPSPVIAPSGFSRLYNGGRRHPGQPAGGVGNPLNEVRPG